MLKKTIIAYTEVNCSCKLVYTLSLNKFPEPAIVHQGNPHHQAKSQGLKSTLNIGVYGCKLLLQYYVYVWSPCRGMANTSAILCVTIPGIMHIDDQMTS